LLIIGLFLSFSEIIIIIGITVLFSGIFLFLSIKGCIIDLENKRIKPYIVFLFFKIGIWKNSGIYNRLSIELEKESLRLNSRGTHSDYNTRRYFVMLKSNDNLDEIILKSFPKPEQAKSYKQEMLSIFSK